MQNAEEQGLSLVVQMKLKFSHVGPVARKWRQDFTVQKLLGLSICKLKI
jgi:hypothetical protein